MAGNVATRIAAARDVLVAYCCSSSSSNSRDWFEFETTWRA